MRDPYQVLGVDRTSGMDEIKKAYRKLSRIYHPDANVNNPNKDQAEVKFKEIQAAYQQIVDEKENGGRSAYGQSGYYGAGSQGGYQNQSYGGFEDFFGGYGGQRQESTDSPRLQAAINYIRNGYYKEAVNVLESMMAAERNAKWYYYSAQANYGLGNNITAQEHAARAVQMEPGNYQYEMLLRRLQSGESWYAERGTSYGRSVGGVSSFCCECLMLNFMCNCCC